MRHWQKSVDNRVFTGVCGGLGEWARVSPNLVRVLWIVLSVFAELGIPLTVLYIVLTFVLPNADGASNDSISVDMHQPRQRGWGTAIAIGLIVAGCILLVRSILDFDSVKYIRPVLWIGAGVLLIFFSLRGTRK